MQQNNIVLSDEDSSLNKSVVAEKSKIAFNKEVVLDKIYDLIISLYIAIKKALAVSLTFTVEIAKVIKSFVVTRIFYGRGSLYRYIAILSIFIPLAISIFIYVHKNQQTQDSQKISISSPLINNAINTTNKDTIEGKVVEIQNNLVASQLNNWYEVKTGDTMTTIANKYNTTNQAIEWANNLNSDSVHPGQKLHIITVQGIIYTIQSGDNLDKIAKKYQSSAQDIIDWNYNINDANNLPTNTKIIIPGGKEPSLAYNGGYNGYQGQAVIADPSAKCDSSDNWCFLQADPRWGRMGMGYSSVSIANAGCLVTSAAMIAAKYYPQYGFTPARIAANPSYFAGGGLFRTNDGLGGLFNTTIFAGNDWGDIDNALAQGHPVIVHIGWVHYVVLTEKVSGGYRMKDPALGGNLIFPNSQKGWVSEAILYTPR